jgi:hypothetical protein
LRLHLPNEGRRALLDGLGSPAAGTPIRSPDSHPYHPDWIGKRLGLGHKRLTSEWGAVASMSMLSGASVFHRAKVSHISVTTVKYLNSG